MKLITIKDDEYSDEMYYKGCENEYRHLNGAIIMLQKYHSESYEGWGECLLLNERGWVRLYLGHCSCNWPPIDDNPSEVTEGPYYQTLSELETQCSGELVNELGSLIAKAREEGYE